MFSCPPCASKSLPKEFRNSADALFPPGGFRERKGPTIEAARAFAETLGIGEDFSRFWGDYKSDKAPMDFLECFQNNLDLLIQKTWVEKTEENRKEDLLDKVPPFISYIEGEKYSDALEEFGVILEELASLFFGAQCQKTDFIEYALRIDPLFGLFWWYSGHINYEHGWIKSVDKDVLFAMLLLGICYLTDF
ncbi:MAG: hypothetical protein FWH35_10300 [Treponema sp.]|nr:hypothetical protein [Treponema sp.]